MQNVYEICFYGGLVLAILLLIAAIVLFIVLKIPKVIGELTGSAAKKAMKEMQDGTASPGSVAKKEQEKYYNMGSGKITAKEAVSTREDRKANGNDSTELLEKSKKKEKKFEETDILRPGINDYDTPDDGETEVLGSGADDEATDVLRDTSAGDDGATDVLRNDEGDDGATDVLRNDEGDDGATDVLRNDEGDDGATMYFGETMQTMRMQPTFCGWTMMTVMQPMYCVPTMTTVMQPMYYVQMMTRKVQAC